MNKKRIFIQLCILSLLASILACNVPGSQVTVVPEDDGNGTVPVTITETPELPPPAVATLRVAYIKADNIWLWTEGTGSSQLTVAGGAEFPVISSDGLVVAFLERQLVSAAFLSSLAPAGDTAEVNDFVWMPESHSIYFNTLVVAGLAGYRIPQVDLYSLNADGSTDSLTFEEAPGSGGVPNFSPDGNILALTQPDKIIFKDIAGTFRSVALTFPTIFTYSEWTYVPEVVWKPDSSGVWVVIPAPDPLADATQASSFWSVPIAGTATVLDSFVAVPAYSSAPAISPDGNNVLYLASSGSDYTLQVRQIGGLDTGYTFAESGRIGIVNWSPDSTRFIYWLPERSNTFIAAVGVVAYAVSDTSANANPTDWIDNSRVIYISDGGELRIRLVEGASTLIDTGVTEYNFGFWVH
jgi:hypothetical protein